MLNDVPLGSEMRNFFSVRKSISEVATNVNRISSARLFDSTFQVIRNYNKLMMVTGACFMNFAGFGFFVGEGGCLWFNVYGLKFQV